MSKIDYNKLLRQYAEVRKIDQISLAQRMGVSYHTLRSWMRDPNAKGYRVMPRKKWQLLP